MNMTTRRLRLSLAVLVSAFMLIGSLAGAAAQGQGNPGTIKVNGQELAPPPSNEPHQGCSFFIESYGFPEGSADTPITFTAQEPSGSDLLLQDVMPLGTSNDESQAESKLFDLESYLGGLDYQQNQGYHIKVELPELNKSKVFWLDCQLETPTPTTPAETPTPTTPAETPTPTTPAETPTTPAKVTKTPTTEATTPVVVSDLPSTGSGDSTGGGTAPWLLLIAAIGLLLAGGMTALRGFATRR